jgi:hypothetical protein
MQPTRRSILAAIAACFIPQILKGEQIRNSVVLDLPDEFLFEVRHRDRVVKFTAKEIIDALTQVNPTLVIPPYREPRATYPLPGELRILTGND